MAVPISRITSQDAKGTTSATYPAPPTDENTLIAVVLSSASAATLTNWTTLNTISFNGASNFLRVFALIASGTNQVVTPGTGTILFTHIFEYKGLCHPVTLDGINQKSGSALTTISPQTGVTTTNPNDLLMVACATGAAVTSPGFDSGFNMLQMDTRLFEADKIVNATGTSAPNATWTTSTTVAIILVALQNSPSVSFGNYMRAGDGISTSGVAN